MDVYSTVLRIIYISNIYRIYHGNMSCVTVLLVMRSMCIGLILFTLIYFLFFYLLFAKKNRIMITVLSVRLCLQIITIKVKN